MIIERKTEVTQDIMFRETKAINQEVVTLTRIQDSTSLIINNTKPLLAITAISPLNHMNKPSLSKIHIEI